MGMQEHFDAEASEKALQMKLVRAAERDRERRQR